MKLRNLLLIAAAIFSPLLAVAQTVNTKNTAAGLQVGTRTTDKVGFHGATPVAQRSGVAQSALTDSTGGTAATTLTSGVGIQVFTIPLSSLATGLSTSALDVTNGITPGFAGKLLRIDFVTTIVGAGSGASQVFNLAINSTATTGGVVTVNLTGTNTIGKVTAGTAITAAQTFTSTDTISLKMAASGTVFTSGAGYFLVSVQNLETVNAFSSLARLANELRAAATEKGLIKGGS